MDYVAMPIPELDKHLKLLDMKQHICGIIQVCDPAGNPYAQALPYALFFNDLTCVSHWICSGELNEDGIFHVHVMFRTPQRSDSTRRSMISTWNALSTSDNWIGQFLQENTMECLKLQKCFKPSSMLNYLLKSPAWVCSNTDQLLDIAHSCREWKLYERFVKQSEKPDTSPQMNVMTKEICDIIMDHNCKTIEDCFKVNSEIMSKYLHKPGLESIVKNCLTFVKATGSGFALSFYERFDPRPDRIHQVLLHQGIEPSIFDKCMFDWLLKRDSKRNTIVLQGPSNTGKSAFISGLKMCMSWGEIVNTNSGFAFEGLLDNTIGIWEEPLCGPELAEKAKQVLEGMVCSIPVKYRKPQKLPRTPIIITTNHNLWRFCSQEEDMFRNRMWIFYFNYQCKDEPYLCRTCEYGCKCSYCTASRSCSSPHGESEPCKVQRTNEPLLTGEQWSLRTEQTTDVRTRSMSGTGEGTSRSHHSTCRSSSPSTTEQRSNSPGYSSSTSTTTSRGMGRRTITRSSSTRNRDDSTQSEHGQCLESNVSTRRDGNDSSTNGSRPGKRKFKRKHIDGPGSNLREHDTVSELGLLETPSKTKKTIPISTQQSRLDRFLAPIESTTDIMNIPNKCDWQMYLSFIFQTFKDG